MSKKIANFAKELKARLSQDSDGVIVAKNQRKADSAINGQIAALKSKAVDLEATVEDRTEELQKAKYPTTLITDNQSFVQGIVNATSRLDNAKAALADVNKSIEFFTQLQKENNEEVDDVEVVSNN